MNMLLKSPFTRQFIPDETLQQILAQDTAEAVYLLNGLQVQPSQGSDMSNTAPNSAASPTQAPHTQSSKAPMAEGDGLHALNSAIRIGKQVTVNMRSALEQLMLVKEERLLSNERRLEQLQRLIDEPYSPPEDPAELLPRSLPARNVQRTEQLEDTETAEERKERIEQRIAQRIKNAIEARKTSQPKSEPSSSSATVATPQPSAQKPTRAQRRNAKKNREHSEAQMAERASDQHSDTTEYHDAASQPPAVTPHDDDADSDTSRDTQERTADATIAEMQAMIDNRDYWRDANRRAEQERRLLAEEQAGWSDDGGDGQGVTVFEDAVESVEHVRSSPDPSPSGNAAAERSSKGKGRAVGMAGAEAEDKENEDPDGGIPRYKGRRPEGFAFGGFEAK